MIGLRLDRRAGVQLVSQKLRARLRVNVSARAAAMRAASGSVA